MRQEVMSGGANTGCVSYTAYVWRPTSPATQLVLLHDELGGGQSAFLQAGFIRSPPLCGAESSVGKHRRRCPWEAGYGRQRIHLPSPGESLGWRQPSESCRRGWLPSVG